MSHPENPQLRRTLGPVMIWGLGVGYVISGMYFGWNLGLPVGGPVGLLIATGVVTAMYVCFVLSYAELACAIPRAGGAFDYATRAFGARWGFVTGLAQAIEFVFAPPAIAAAIGAYFALFLPAVKPELFAVGAYLLFTGLNIWGVKQSAIFELVVTVLAVGELLLFAAIALPSFSWEAFTTDPLPNGVGGIIGAIPFAIWFYLAIEGIANAAEEAREPQRDLSRGFISAMGTLVVLAALVLFGAVGVKGWRAVVYAAGSDAPSDSPLPLALGHVVGTGHPMFHLLVTIGVFGLVASFHGILLAAGRATLELGRAGHLPRALGVVSARRGTPARALLANSAVGLVALFTGRTGDIIIVSVFGALTLYVLSMAALFKLRRSEPQLERPFRTPLYPWVPGVALGLALGCLVAMAIANPIHAALFAALTAVGTGLFLFLHKPAQPPAFSK
jgi:ethanolamine permease